MNEQDYYEWLKKFETKKTTDDTYTPPLVYKVVYDYVGNELMPLDGLDVLRPFYPNGDYEAVDYKDNSIVIDNPPFSILSKICRFYQRRGIRFFLFAPALTAFNLVRGINGVTVIVAPATITYDNGAVIETAFITNLSPNIKVKTAPSLSKALMATQQLKRKMPKYCYPDNVLMISQLQKLCKYNVDFEIMSDECCFIDYLEQQKSFGKKLFGGGFLISDEKAQELLQKRRQIKNEEYGITWKLSPSEQEKIAELNNANGV